MKAGLPVLAATFALAACVPSSKPPAPVAAPAVRPAPVPARPAPAPVLPAPVESSWMDAPATPGDWRYGTRADGTEARFLNAAGAPMARLRCMADARLVVLSLPESGARRPLVTIRTETAARTVEAMAADREMTAAFAPSDPLLDAMALSKGRFAVESDGLPTLYLPSWAEVSRVIEDCR